MVMVMVVVGEDVLHHVKGRGNCPGGEMSGERAVRNVSRGSRDTVEVRDSIHGSGSLCRKVNTVIKRARTGKEKFEMFVLNWNW